MNRLLPLLFLAGCTAQSTPAVVAPPHQVKVLSAECDPNYSRPRADVTVVNTGTTTIAYPKGFVSFGGAMQDGYFRPYPIRPGGMASLSVYANTGDSASCSLVSIADSDGHTVALSR